MGARSTAKHEKSGTESLTQVPKRTRLANCCCLSILRQNKAAITSSRAPRCPLPLSPSHPPTHPFILDPASPGAPRHTPAHGSSCSYQRRQHKAAAHTCKRADAVFHLAQPTACRHPSRPANSSPTPESHASQQPASMTMQRSHNRSTSVSSLASIASFKTAHSASPPRDHIDLRDDPSVDPADNPSLDHTAEDEMLLTPVSSSSSGPPSPPQPQSQAALVAAMQTPLPPTPPPRRRTLLLGKGHPRRNPSMQESNPPSSLPSHTETPQTETESAGRSQAISENGPASPRSLASRLSLASLGEQQQSPTSYESHASRPSHQPSQPHSAAAPEPAQRELPTNSSTTEEKHGAHEGQAQAREQARMSRPPRSQARKVSKTMQLARDEPSTAPLRPGSSASVASAASSVNGRTSPTSPIGRPPQYSDSAQSHAVPQTPPTHTRSSSSARSDYPSFEEQDDAWAANVKAQLLRLFPDLGATLPDRSVPTSGIRDELSALRSEIGALRGVVGQLRDERAGRTGGTPPLATKSQRAHSVPVPDQKREAGPAKSRSLAIDTTLANANAGSDADDSVYSEEEVEPIPRRRAAMPPRERLSMYYPAHQEPEMNSAGLTIFATDSDARITLPPSAISLMLDVVRTVDMKTNGVRSDADIFSEENLANLAISQVMN